MKVPCYMKPFGDKVLLTNDLGRYAFLSNNEFKAFYHSDLDKEGPVWRKLEDNLFCYHGSLEEYIRRAEGEIRSINSYLFEPTTLFIIVLTNECNNRCIYCQADGNASPRRMSSKDADMILHRITESPAKNISIEFQGGEPLICFDLIKYIIQRGEEILTGKEVRYSLVSNLIMLTEEMAAFFEEHHVSISASLDGPKELHDCNRPQISGKGSYEPLIRGIQILREHHILSGAIQTTTAESLRYPREIVRTYEKLGFQQIFLRNLTKLGAAARNWERIGYTPEAYLHFYREALDEIICLNLNGKKMMDYFISLFLSKIFIGKSVNYMELRSPCGAAIGQVAFTPGGNVYTCDEGRMMAEMGDDLFLLGNVYKNGYDDWMNSDSCKSVCSASLLDSLPDCCDCVYKPYCGVCPVINYALNGNITSVSKDRCKIFKGILDLIFEYIYKGDEKVMMIFRDWSESV